jgi:putative oxidoreductase
MRSVKYTLDTAPAYSAWGLTFLRIVVGAVFLRHGLLKLSDFNGAVGLFEAMHMPLPFFSAVVVTLVEVLGGVALLLGFFTRLAAALVALDMLVAVLVVYLKPTFFQKGGIELPITLLAASVALAALGGGAALLDSFIFKPTSRPRAS